MKEQIIQTRSGGVALVLCFLVLFPACIAGLVFGIKLAMVPLIIASIVGFIVFIFAWAGFFTVEPNQAVAITLFGDYKGSVKQEGLKWANPFMTKTKVSQRTRNFESDKLKVNDLSGSPIQIAAVVVWRVADSAEALFAVDDYESFVRTQSEAALRSMASSYPYDAEEGTDTLSLRADAGAISDHLTRQIQERLEKAGVYVVETRISHLAYAPEIASAMLQRQQAAAIIDARQKIVEGAVGMVEMALEKLDEKEVINLDEERKAAMVSNLLVVLCGDKATQPIVNTGTLYN